MRWRYILFCRYRLSCGFETKPNSQRTAGRRFLAGHELAAFNSPALRWIRASSLAKNVGGKPPRSWAEVIDLDSARSPAPPPIVVNAHKDAVIGPVGDRSPRRKRNEVIPLSCLDHMKAFASEGLSPASSPCRVQELFPEPPKAGGRRDQTTMARVNNDSAKSPAPCLYGDAHPAKIAVMSKSENANGREGAAISCCLHTRGSLPGVAKNLRKVEESGINATF